MHKHYIRADAEGNVIHAFSNAFEQPELNDLLVTEEGGRHFNLDLWYNGVIPRWNYNNNGLIERTELELQRLLKQYQLDHPKELSDIELLQKRLLATELENVALKNADLDNKELIAGLFEMILPIVGV
jgi:hypothetical protein